MSSYFKPTASKAIIHRKYGRLSLSALDEETGKALLFEENKPHVIELTEEGKHKCFSEKELMDKANATSDVNELLRIGQMTYKKNVLKKIQEKVNKILPADISS